MKEFEEVLVPVDGSESADSDIRVTDEPLVLIGDPSEEIFNYLSKHPRNADGPVTLAT